MTPRTMENDTGQNETPLRRALRIAGGQAPLARKATPFGPPGKKLTQGMIWKWLNTAKEPVPTPHWVIPIELAVSGQVKRGELRPDLYPPEQLALGNAEADAT